MYEGSKKENLPLKKILLQCALDAPFDGWGGDGDCRTFIPYSVKSLKTK